MLLVLGEPLGTIKANKQDVLPEVVHLVPFLIEGLRKNVTPSPAHV